MFNGISLKATQFRMQRMFMNENHFFSVIAGDRSTACNSERCNATIATDAQCTDGGHNAPAGGRARRPPSARTRSEHFARRPSRHANGESGGGDVCQCGGRPLAGPVPSSLLSAAVCTVRVGTHRLLHVEYTGDEQCATAASGCGGDGRDGRPTAGRQPSGVEARLAEDGDAQSEQGARGVQVNN